VAMSYLNKESDSSKSPASDGNSSRWSDFDHTSIYPSPGTRRDLSPSFIPYVSHRDSRRPTGFAPQTYGMPPPIPPMPLNTSPPPARTAAPANP
jgi:hypothetical protein